MTPTAEARRTTRSLRATSGHHRLALTGWRDPESVATHLVRSGADVVWRDAGPDATDGISVIGWGSSRLESSVTDRAATTAVLARLARARHLTEATHLGWFGWFGYGTTATTLAPSGTNVARSLADPTDADIAFLCVDRAIVFDHRHLVVTAEALPAQARWLDAIAAEWHRRWPLPTAVPTPPRRPQSSQWSLDDTEYLRLIERCQHAIAAGETFVMCPTTRATVDAPREDSLLTYRRLRRHSPSPRGMFARIGPTTVASSTPERFLAVDADGRVRSSPIKGTRPRSSDPEHDRRLAAELSASAKERAENVMIVDLVRNDLGRTCRTGSIIVPELLAVQSFRHVHQLQSTVEGILDEGTGPLHAVDACFPPGSMTGAPKQRAVDMLAVGEPVPRGIYSGAIGRIGFDGTADLSVVIRTVVVSHGTARVAAGAGITIDSDAAAELDEVKTKATPLLEILGATT
jgi:para-aminobenzoate synthetase component I